MMLLLVDKVTEVFSHELDAARLELNCRTKVEEATGQEIMASEPERVMPKRGEPGTCTAEIILQKPPVNE